MAQGSGKKAGGNGDIKEEVGAKEEHINYYRTPQETLNRSESNTNREEKSKPRKKSVSMCGVL